MVGRSGTHAAVTASCLGCGGLQENIPCLHWGAKAANRLAVFAMGAKDLVLAH